MSLIDSMKTPCVFMERTRTPDGEGGYITAWTEGAKLEAAITFNSSIQARVAEKSGVTSLYTVTVDKKVGLEYHDVIKRLSDGKVFRITSDGDDIQTPDRAMFQFSQVTAEEYTLT